MNLDKAIYLALSNMYSAIRTSKELDSIDKKVLVRELERLSQLLEAVNPSEIVDV